MRLPWALRWSRLPPMLPEKDEAVDVEAIERDVDATLEAADRVSAARKRALAAKDASLLLLNGAVGWMLYKEAKRLSHVASETMEQAKRAYQDANESWRSVESVTVAHESHWLAALAREAALAAKQSANCDCNIASNLVYEVHQNCKDVIARLSGSDSADLI